MKKYQVVGLLLAGLCLCTETFTFAQTISVFDTVYTPPGYPEGPLLARMFVPAVSNGIGVVLLHGSGQNRLVAGPWCDTLAAYGYVAMSIEYPDFAPYPREARTAKVAVEFLRRNASRFGITTGKIAGFGMSQGAYTWGETIIWDNNDAYFQTDSTVDDRLNAAVLLYGGYDYYLYDSTFFQSYFSGDSSRLLKGTCVKHVANITTPVLLLHGAGDNTVPAQLSVELYDSLIARGKTAQLKLFDGQDHGFDVTVGLPDAFTAAGLIAKDTALSFLRRMVAPALKIRVSSSLIDFGNVATSSSETLSVRIDNIGSSDLELDSPAHGGSDYTLSNLPPFPASLVPRASIRFDVLFHPVSHGLARDTIVLASDDTLHPIVKIALRGRGISAIARAQKGVTYTTSGAQPEGQLYTTSLSTGDVTPIGPLGVAEIRGLTVRPSTGELFGSLPTPSSTTFYRVSTDSGEAVFAGRVPLGNLCALAFGPGDRLYGGTTSGNLYRIDLSTGATTFVGRDSGLSYSGFAFSPRSGKLWASVRTPLDSIYTIDTANGMATFIGTTGFNALTSSLAFDYFGNLYGLIDNGSGEDYLAILDTSNGTGTLVNNGNPLGVNNLLAMAMRSDSTVSAVVEKSMGPVPESYSMDHNYPNPFNPGTTIRFSLPHAGHVVLKVFNMLGEELATLVSRELAAGTYDVRWDATDLPSGVYLCRLQAGSFSGTRKLLLMR